MPAFIKRKRPRRCRRLGSRGISQDVLPQKQLDDYETCIFDDLGKENWTIFKNLGEVCDLQLNFCNKSTRGTQVDWNWKIMAQRWRHAKIIEPSLLESPVSNPMKELKELREMRRIDKMVDTNGLNFDPADPNLRYTRRPSKMEVLVAVESPVEAVSKTTYEAEQKPSVKEVSMPNEPLVENNKEGVSGDTEKEGNKV